MKWNFEYARSRLDGAFDCVRRSVELGMRTFFEGTWEGQEVVLVLSRVGKVSAAISTLLLLERFGATHIVFTGLAGAIDPGLRIGDVVIAERLVQHDMDASPLPAFKRFEIPLLGKSLGDLSRKQPTRPFTMPRATYMK
jgi:adenosylhomocysteine nucleosidase